MTETPEETVTLEWTFRKPGGGNVFLRQLALGYSPAILIEPTAEDGEFGFCVDVTGLDPEETAQVLSMLAEHLEANLDKVEEVEEDVEELEEEVEE